MKILKGLMFGVAIMVASMIYLWRPTTIVGVVDVENVTAIGKYTVEYEGYLNRFDYVEDDERQILERLINDPSVVSVTWVDAFYEGEYFFYRWTRADGWVVNGDVVREK